MVANSWPRDRQLFPKLPAVARQEWRRGGTFYQGDDDVTDLSKLTDDELELLGRLLLKAAGEFEGDAVPTFRIERVFVDAGEPTAGANHVER